ncbi:MAG: deoxyhypusine synthase family protein [Pirellulaceae bacterium]
MSVSQFLDKHFLHFNARELVDSARTYRKFIDDGGKMFVTLAGAMSTAELGKSLAEMIRQDKVHAISCTAANLEEDVFNLVGHDEYRTVSNYRDLSPEDELKLRDEGFNRVTDTCIPEDVFRDIEKYLTVYWREGVADGRRYLPSEMFFRLFEEKALDDKFQVPKEDSWLYAAWQKGIPVYAPGYEDSTLGNIFAARDRWDAFGPWRDQVGHRANGGLGSLVHGSRPTFAHRLLPDRWWHRR